MGFWNARRERRVALTIPESVGTLTYMDDFFAVDDNWVQNRYSDGAARCLVGAANHVRVSRLDEAKYWLRQAIAELEPNTKILSIERFNDKRGRSIDEIRAVVARAKELALAAQRPAPVAEILPPVKWPQIEGLSSVPAVPAPQAAPVTYQPSQASGLGPSPFRTTRQRRGLFDWLGD